MERIVKFATEEPVLFLGALLAGVETFTKSAGVESAAVKSALGMVKTLLPIFGALAVRQVVKPVGSLLGGLGGSLGQVGYPSAAKPVK